MRIQISAKSHSFLNSILAITLLLCSLSMSELSGSELLPVLITYSLICFLWSFVTREYFFSIPILFIRITEFVRYYVIAYIMSTSGIRIHDSSVILIMTVEMVSVNFGLFLYVFRHVNANQSDDGESLRSMTTTQNFHVGIASFIVLVVGMITVITNPSIINKFFYVFRGSGELYQTDNGLIGLIINSFLLLLLLSVFVFIERKQQIPKALRVIVIVIVGGIYALGSSISTNDMSRWGLVINLYFLYIVIIRFHPEIKRGMLIVFALAGVAIILFGTTLKYQQIFSNTGIYNKGILELSSYRTLNAYFSGPSNMIVGNRVIENLNVPRLYVLISDLFANCPILNRYIGDPSINSVALFNYQVYGSTIAIDQIMPLACQMRLYFGWLFFVPEIAFSYYAVKLYTKAMKTQNLLLLYCLIKVSFAFSRIDCINLNIIMQNIWIGTIPVLIIYLIDYRWTHSWVRIKQIP